MALPLGATTEPTTKQMTARGDAAAVRGIAATLLVLALCALLLIERPTAYVVAGTIVAVAVALFAAASWRRARA